MNKVIKDLSFAIGQSKCSKSDAAVNELREILSDASKHTEDVVSSQHNYIFTDCMSSVIDLLSRGDIPDDIKEQSANLLGNLIRLDSKCLEILDDELGLTRTLLQCLANRPPSALQIQMFKLLQQATYESKLTWLNTEEAYSISMTHVIVDNILENPVGQPFEISLGILVNFCRNDRCRNFLKNIDRFSRLKSLLLGSLNADNLRVIIYSMSLIFLLSSSSEKVFSTRNIHQTLEVIFNTLVNNSSGWTPFYAADLLIDLAEATRSRPYLENFQYLSSCLRNISVLICQKARHVQRKCLQLLLAFCKVSQRLRRAISELFFSRDSIQSDEHFSRHLANPGAGKECLLFALTGLATESGSESVLAAGLLRAVYEDFLTSGSSLEPRLLLIDRTITSTPPSAASPAESEPVLEKWSHLIELSTVLLDHDSWFPLVTQKPHAELLERLIATQLDSNPLCTAMKMPCEERASQHGARLALRCLHFMYAIAERHQGATSFEGSLSAHLQDSRVMPLLAFGLQSGEPDTTQMALGLCAAGLLLENFCITLLGDCLSNFAKSGHRTVSKSAPSFPSDARPGLLPSGQENRPPAHALPDKLEKAVTQLVESFGTGVTLKDAKSSELLSLYEHKLQTLQTKESHLEDLLSTKTMALAQADALIAKYRSRLATSEAENSSLRCLLLEHERLKEAGEEALERQNAACKELSREKTLIAAELKKTAAKLQETAASLAKSTEQSRRLQESLQEASAALKKAQEKGQRLQEETSSKGKRIGELDKNIDSYRCRLDEAEQVIREKNKQIAKFSELTKMINSLTVDPDLAETNVGNLASGNSNNSS